jgi:hypothetical protein
MMGHFGFIMAHGRRSRAYRRLRSVGAAFGEGRVGTTAPRSGGALDVGLIDQRSALHPNLQRLALQNHKKDRVRSDWDMQTDPEESNSRVAQKRMLE